MLNDLPDDILSIIIKQTCIKPSNYLTLMNINQRINQLINTYDDLYTNGNDTYEEDMNDICLKQTNIHTFNWLMKNNIIFTLENIKYLIIYNRIDVFRQGIYHEKFLKILFNRFYIHIDESHSTYDIFSFIEIKNPLLIAGIHNRIEIIELLLTTEGVHKNPYLNSISVLLDISIKYNHKNLFLYLIINHYDVIKENVQRKLNTIIYRINNCEDILFHLMINKKITIHSKHFHGIIAMNYNSFFKTYYKNRDGTNLLGECIDGNNIEIFNYLVDITKDHIDKTKIGDIIFENKRKITRDFVYNLINNHIELISMECPLINLCILHDIEDYIIIKLVKEGYSFTNEDMKIILQEMKIKILETMCHEYNKN